MFSNFYPDAAVEKASTFADQVSSKSDRVSAAQVQGLFMFFKDSADAALENAFRLYTPPTPTKAGSEQSQSSVAAKLNSR